jgi:hypothetical protein
MVGHNPKHHAHHPDPYNLRPATSRRARRTLVTDDHNGHRGVDDSTAQDGFAARWRDLVRSQITNPQRSALDTLED